MIVIKLPKPTSQTETGPIINMNDSDLFIKYDYQDNEGNATWTTLFFKCIYSFRFIECEYTNTVDYVFGMVEVNDSMWVKELTDNWVSNGSRESDAFGGENYIHHYRLYFDDNGIYDIVCKEFTIN